MTRIVGREYLVKLESDCGDSPITVFLKSKAEELN